MPYPACLGCAAQTPASDLPATSVPYLDTSTRLTGPEWPEPTVVWRVPLRTEGGLQHGEEEAGCSMGKKSSRQADSHVSCQWPPVQLQEARYFN